jgi:hypothetical protein
MQHIVSPRGTRSPRRTAIALLFIGIGSLPIAACVSVPQPQSASAPDTPMEKSVTATQPVVPPNQAGASALSYGTVTAAVVRNKTTQFELIQMFGGPNISTVDAEGTETWIYERSVSQTDVVNKSQDWQAAANLGAAFGNLQAGGGVSGGQSSGATSMASSFRTLTAIVKFNPDKTVKDYALRASQF